MVRIFIIELLLTSQLHNAGQLSSWCQHFSANNYSVFEHMEEFSLLGEEVKVYISKHCWPPLSYLEAMEEYRKKYDSVQDEDEAEGKERPKADIWLSANVV